MAYLQGCVRAAFSLVCHRWSTGECTHLSHLHPALCTHSHCVELSLGQVHLRKENSKRRSAERRIDSIYISKLYTSLVIFEFSFARTRTRQLFCLVHQAPSRILSLRDTNYSYPRKFDIHTSNGIALPQPYNYLKSCTEDITALGC